ncbi:YrrS family protein [Gracilibacillus alcaliphilus]|uniref:YrrS family protein n=1 Tax=Gracilibacillus alcaliphilus TaxID=1401441 RepID=UPI00195AF8A7|nr:YrrS family protein [Gracilibacillus alcaliphilus]MBM7679399.1 hypothetical protein [Gracilibacillus alcaliphilus]
MTDNNESNTRRDRFEKKRTNTKAITWLSIIGGSLIVALIVVISVNLGNDSSAANDNQNTAEFALGSSNDKEEKKGLEVNEVEGEDDEEDENELKEVESSDSNVARAYESNWEPIGTSQSGPHTTSFDKNSTDWQEMKKAVEVATGIPSDEQVEWWFGSAGEQGVEATVSPKSNQDEVYRVHLEWVDGEGWKPVLVEELISNDRG